MSAGNLNVSNEGAFAARLLAAPCVSSTEAVKGLLCVLILDYIRAQRVLATRPCAVVFCTRFVRSLRP